jgi:hypothetical protein
MNDGGPAFPVIAENGLGHVNEGMSLRDYLASKAMAALITRPLNACSTGNNNLKWAEATRNPMGRVNDLAADSYRIADAMLAEREKQSRLPDSQQA